MRSAASLRRFALVSVLVVACGRADSGDSNIARGRGLTLARLPPEGEARIHEEAIRAAFDLGPSLALLLHPRRLPRTAGTDGGDPVPTALLDDLRKRGIIRGLCDPIRDGVRNTPRCELAVPGYVLRASEILRVAADTVEVYLSAERFGAATGQKPEALRFEKIYQLVGNGTTWRVAREARVPDRTR